VSHGTVPLLYAMLFLALSPCDRALALGPWVRRLLAARTGRAAAPARRTSTYARWPLDLLFVELAAFYFLAGVSKLRDSGLAWADGYTLQYRLLANGTPAGEWLAQHLGWCSALSWLVLAFELGAPLGMVRRLRPLVLGGGLLFHLGTTRLLAISFWPVAALYALFVPWTRLGRLVGVRVRRAWPAPDPSRPAASPG